MTMFGRKLVKIESKLLANAEKTKFVFPEETQTIEFGLELMTNLTRVMNDNVKSIWKKPNQVANFNLFARNRQLLLNAYLCALNSSYGTQFVVLRTVLENNNLMRFFNSDPKSAFEWLSSETQERFPSDVRSLYPCSRSGM